VANEKVPHGFEGRGLATGKRCTGGKEKPPTLEKKKKNSGRREEVPFYFVYVCPWGDLITSRREHA